MLIKIISFNLTLNLLAHYDIMNTTIVKHLLYSYTLFLRVFKTHSLPSLIFNYIEYFILIYTVSHFSYAPLFQGPHFLTKMLESNILYDNLFIDILSV